MSSQTFETYVVDGYAEEGFVTNVNTLDVELQAGQSTTDATVYIQKPVQELASGDATVSGLAERTSENNGEVQALSAQSSTVAGLAERVSEGNGETQTITSQPSL